MEKLIRDLNSRMYFINGEIRVGNDRGQETYYLYFSGNLELVTFNFIEILRIVKKYI